MDMLTFVQCFKEFWRTHGWGKLEFDPQYRDRGLIIIKTSNSAFSRSLPGEQRPSCFLENWHPHFFLYYAGGAGTGGCTNHL
jgi:hypothetical protein